MKTRDWYADQAAKLLSDSVTILRPHDEGPCEADRLIAAAQVHATLATVAPVGTSVEDELTALRSAVAAMLHDADTSADHQLRTAIDQFRSTLAGTTHGGPVLALVEDLVDEMARDAADGAASHRPVRTGGESR